MHILGLFVLDETQSIMSVLVTGGAGLLERVTAGDSLQMAAHISRR